MADALANLAGPGKPLRAEPADPQEIVGLLRTGTARLHDACIETLAIESRPEVWRVLDKAHNVRNVGEYEGLLDVDERLLSDLIQAAKAVAAKL